MDVLFGLEKLKMEKHLVLNLWGIWKKEDNNLLMEKNI